MKHAKNSLALVLGLLLTLSLCTPALAADTAMDQELSAVTLAVKRAVPVADYEKFSGTPNDMGAVRRWSLYWSSSDGSTLRVLAGTDGKVYQYSLNPVMPLTRSNSGYSAKLAKVTPEKAAAQAAAFFKKVAGANERIETPAVSALSGYDDAYSFSAPLLLNGVPSGIEAQFSVSAADGTVTAYSRSDAYAAFVNALPSAVPAVSAADAAKTLNGTVKLALQYVLDGKQAVLRYLPVAADQYYVDAQTGKLVSLTQAWSGLRDGVAGKGGLTAATADSQKNESLSAAEQAAIAKLQGVQTKEQLDAAVRKVAALGLGRYTLSSAQYAQDDSDDTLHAVTCTLIYKRTLALSELDGVTAEQYGSGQEYQQVRLITVDAKTAELLTGWTWGSENLKEKEADPAAMQPAADAFLKLYAPRYAAETALADSNRSGDFRYDRKENGYFYHNNSVNISIDPTDSSVAAFSTNWDEKLTFRAPGTPVSAQTALDAYCGAFTARLQYISHPVAVDTGIPIWKTYAACCGSVAYRFVLGYAAETDGAAVSGVDAATGKVVRDEAAPAAAPYTDIASSFARAQIQALADSGIRFNATGKFLPNAKLTEQDLLVLLLNADGYSFTTEELSDKDSLEQLYNAAWEQGFLPQGQKHPAKAVTRLELVRMLISASPYAQAAQLKGIFVTKFRDASQVSASDLGYLAIAQGLGVVGGSGGYFHPGRTATRAEAAVMLYNYMSR